MRILSAIIVVLDTVAFRELPSASVVAIYVGASGAECHGADTVFPGDSRLLGAPGLFLASVSYRGFRGLPWAPVVSIFVCASGAEARSADAEFPGNIRILGGRLADFSLSQLPWGTV